MGCNFKHGINLILKEFEIELENESKYDDFLKALNKFYQDDNYRHYYHEITEYVDKAESEAMEVLSNNIRYILETKKCRKNIYKLADHLSMELIRKRQINIFKKTIEEYEQVIDSLELKMKEYNNVKNNIDKLKRKQKNITKDFIVILGIFAAIFMAFDSGLKIELEILKQVNDYAKGVLIIFIALFTYVLLKSFYKFIINIYTDTITEENTIANKLETDKTQKKFLKWIWQHIAHILLALSAILYCILVGLIDKQYEQKIKPIVKEEISKLQQKEEKGNIIIYNNTSSTQNQENGLVQQQKTNNKQIKTNKNSDICKPIQK